MYEQSGLSDLLDLASAAGTARAAKDRPPVYRRLVHCFRILAHAVLRILRPQIQHSVGIVGVLGNVASRHLSPPVRDLA